MIEKEQIHHIAKLARLQLRKEEVENYQQDLSQILDYFEILKDVDTEGVESMTHSVLLESVARQDIPQREHPDVISKMLQLAPRLKEGFFQVKAIFSSR